MVNIVHVTTALLLTALNFYKAKKSSNPPALQPASSAAHLLAAKSRDRRACHPCVVTCS